MLDETHAVARLKRTTVLHRDGRRIHLYGSFEPTPSGYGAPDHADRECDRRWNPLRREWVLIATSHQAGPLLPEAQDCPLCPSRPGHSSEIPARWFGQAVIENQFPTSRKPAGTYEIVVYSQDHEASFSVLAPSAVHNLVDLWTDRYLDLASRDDVDYVFIFENRGEAAGANLHHPHGEIYGYPFIPPVARAELRASRASLRRQGKCLQCALIEMERKEKKRVLSATGGVLAYVPSYGRFPYEVHVAVVRHGGSLPDLSSSERRSLGDALQMITRVYDQLFGIPMPYMMVMHQKPTDGRPHPEAHLHVEFYPVMRAAGRLKFLAGGECGAGAFVSDGLPEEKAAELKRLV